MSTDARGAASWLAWRALGTPGTGLNPSLGEVMAWRSSDDNPAMLNRLPHGTPSFSSIVADLGDPSHQAIGRALEVHPRTVARWQALEQAPRCAALALWWLTRAGMSTVDAESVRLAQLQALTADALRIECAALRHELARVVAFGAGSWGCANDPTVLAGPLPGQRMALVNATLRA